MWNVRIGKLFILCMIFCLAPDSDLASISKTPRGFDVHLLHDGRTRHQRVRVNRSTVAGCINPRYHGTRLWSTPVVLSTPSRVPNVELNTWRSSEVEYSPYYSLYSPTGYWSALVL